MSVTSGRTRGGGSRGRAELDGVRRRAPWRAVATGAHRTSSVTVTVTASLLPGLGSQPLTECVRSLGSRAGAEGGEGAPGGLGGPLPQLSGTYRADQNSPSHRCTGGNACHLAMTTAILLCLLLSPNGLDK